MKLKLPREVQEIIDRLQYAGYEAYAVGGCVRDALLSRTPKDWDITTSATPKEVRRLFKRTVPTGIQHGTVTVLFGANGYEVTTYRIDGKYQDHRRPKEISFTKNLREDLLRRDFTINAMAYNDAKGLQDPFGGREDLKRGILRCVGEPRERFEEDALRILRGVRFLAQLDLTVEENTMKAMEELAPTLRYISAERIQTELVKLLISDCPQKIKTAWELGITKIILPEFDLMMTTTQESLHHCYTVGEHTIQALGAIRADKILRLTMLFHDMGKPMRKTMDENQVAHFKMHALDSKEIAKAILKRLKFDNETIRKVTSLVEVHDYRMPVNKKNIRRAVSKIGMELFPLYLEVRRADTMAQSLYQREEKLYDIAQIQTFYEEIVKEGQCVQLKDLAVNGKDLMILGIPSGPQLGVVLKTLLEHVIEHPEENEKECLFSFVRGHFLEKQV